jgi:hypothetical protein
MGSTIAMGVHDPSAILQQNGLLRNQNAEYEEDSALVCESIESTPIWIPQE